MSDLICENYPMVLVMSRFGIDLGFGEKNIGDVCRQNEVDSCTFLTVVNFLTEETPAVINGIDNCLSVGSLITYLHNAHDYFLNFRLPHIRRKLTEAIIGCPGDIAFGHIHAGAGRMRVLDMVHSLAFLYMIFV